MDPYTWLFVSITSVFLAELMVIAIGATIAYNISTRYERRKHMSSNLPPGCSVSDIPGNRPEDLEAEAAEEYLMDTCSEENLTPDEYKIVADVGIAAVKAHREATVKIHDVYKENSNEEIAYHKSMEEDLNNQLDSAHLEIEHLNRRIFRLKQGFGDE